MANLLSGVFHTVEVSDHRRTDAIPLADPRRQLTPHKGLVQSVLAVIQSIFNIIFSVFHGAFTVVWDLIESLAKLVGASAHFVICEWRRLWLLSDLHGFSPPRRTPREPCGRRASCNGADALQQTLLSSGLLRWCS
jgi:hypothetical protein